MNKISDVSLPPHRFVFDKYCGRIGFATSQILRLDAAYQTLGLRPRVKLLGIADAALIPVRQRPGEWAVMVEMPADEYGGDDLVCWFHADELTLRGLGFETT